MNDLVGERTTKSVVLTQGLIVKGVYVVVVCANLVLITKGIENTTRALVSKLKAMSKKVEDNELVDVAAVSVGNNNEVGNMIVEAMSKVGRKGVVTHEEEKSTENSLYVIEGKDGEYFLVKWNESKRAIKRTYVGFKKISTDVKGGLPNLSYVRFNKQGNLAMITTNNGFKILLIASNFRSLDIVGTSSFDPLRTLIVYVAIKASSSLPL
ncbi:hypothetical protein CRYUN_Cryun33cG0006900 [Craigia yunnanensis]